MGELDLTPAAPEQGRMRRVQRPNSGLHHPALSSDLYNNPRPAPPHGSEDENSITSHISSSVLSSISHPRQTVFNGTVDDHCDVPTSSSILLATNSNSCRLSNQHTSVATYPNFSVPDSSLPMEAISYVTASPFPSQQFPAFPTCPSVFASLDTMAYRPEGWNEYAHDVVDQTFVVPDGLRDSNNSLSTSQAGYMTTTTTTASSVPTYYALEPWLAGSAASYMMQPNGSNSNSNSNSNLCSYPTTPPPPYHGLRVESTQASISTATSVSDFSGYDSSFEPPLVAAAAANVPNTTSAPGQGQGQRRPRPRRRQRLDSSSPTATATSTPRSTSTSTAAAATNDLRNFGIPTGNNDGTWRCAHPGCASQAIFRRGCDLRKHFNRHRKYLFCRHEGCPQATEGGFSSQKDRARHEAKHNPGVVCEWEDCARVFSRVDNMKDHVKRIHQRRMLSED